MVNVLTAAQRWIISVAIRSLERNDGNSSARLDTPPSIHVDAYINMFSLRSTSGVINRIPWIYVDFHDFFMARSYLSSRLRRSFSIEPWYSHILVTHDNIWRRKSVEWERQLSHDDARLKRKPAYAHVMREINKFSGLFDRRSEAWWFATMMNWHSDVFDEQ